MKSNTQREEKPSLANSSLANKPDHAASDLTAFQQNILVILADGTQKGLGVKDDLGDYYGEPVNHGRLYPNLDQLVEDGYVDKGKKDDRTNLYRLTEAGRDLLVERREWLDAHLPAEVNG